MAHNGRYAVDVPLAGLYGVEPGEAVEVADSHVRATLDRQGWEYVHPETDPDDTDSNDTESEGDDE